MKYITTKDLGNTRRGRFRYSYTENYFLNLVKFSNGMLASNEILATSPIATINDYLERYDKNHD